MKVLHLDSAGQRGGQRQVDLLQDADSLLLRGGGLRTLHRTLRTYRPELIAAHCSRSHDLALLQFQVPIVVHRRVDFRRRGLKYRAVQGFVAVSRAVRDVLIEGGVHPDRIRVVHDAVQTHAGRKLERPRGLLVLAAGAEVPHKDHSTLREAMRGIAGTLWIAGQGTELGWRDDLPDLLATADVFCHTSTEEGYGSVLLEARLAGTPIVTTRAGGAPEAAGPDALRVPPGDVGALRRALLAAADLPRHPQVLPAHTPQAMQAATRKAYRDLL